MNEDTVTYYVKESREEGKWKEVLEINLWQFYQKCPIQHLLTTTDNHITHIRLQVVNTNSKKNTTIVIWAGQGRNSPLIYFQQKQKYKKGAVAASIQKLRSHGIRNRKNERRSKPHIIFIFQKSRRIRFSYAQAA